MWWNEIVEVRWCQYHKRVVVLNVGWLIFGLYISHYILQEAEKGREEEIVKNMFCNCCHDKCSNNVLSDVFFPMCLSHESVKWSNVLIVWYWLIQRISWSSSKMFKFKIIQASDVSAREPVHLKYYFKELTKLFNFCLAFCFWYIWY